MKIETIPGIAVTEIFDPEYYKPGMVLMVYENRIKMPVEKGGEYLIIGVLEKFPAIVVRVESGGFVLTLKRLDGKERFDTTTFQINISNYIHGYWTLKPAKIVEDDGA